MKSNSREGWVLTQSRTWLGNYYFLSQAYADLAMAVSYLAIWIAPSRFSDEYILSSLAFILLEFFIIVLTGAALSLREKSMSRGRQNRIFFLHCSLYALLGSVVAYQIGTTWIMVVYWIRNLAQVAHTMYYLPAQGPEKEKVFERLVLSAALFIGGGLVTGFIPMPQLGITDEVNSYYKDLLTRGGVETSSETPMIDSITWGFLFYGGLGWYQISQWRKERFLKSTLTDRNHDSLLDEMKKK
ncbi:MAG: hypothetical protein V1799_16345 [bacterium]